MNNYIQIYKDVLDPSYCKDLIHRFEKNKEHHESHDQGPMSFTQINFNRFRRQPQVKFKMALFLKTIGSTRAISVSDFTLVPLSARFSPFFK